MYKSRFFYSFLSSFFCYRIFKGSKCLDLQNQTEMTFQWQKSITSICNFHTLDLYSPLILPSNYAISITPGFLYLDLVWTKVGTWPLMPLMFLHMLKRESSKIKKLAILSPEFYTCSKLCTFSHLRTLFYLYPYELLSLGMDMIRGVIKHNHYEKGMQPGSWLNESFQRSPQALIELSAWWRISKK